VQCASLRELTALVDIDGEAWARRMRALLRGLCHEVNLEVNLAPEHPADQTGALRPNRIRAAERLMIALSARYCLHEALPRCLATSNADGSDGAPAIISCCASSR